MKSILKNYSALALLLFAVSGVTYSGLSVASDEMEYKNMEQMMGSIRLEKRQIESMLDRMMESGRISSDEGAQAKRALASMKENDLENLKSKAIAEVKTHNLLDH